jgi:hypothetical protein
MTARRYLQLYQLAVLSDFENHLVEPLEHLLAHMRQQNSLRTHRIEMLP